MTEGLNLVLSGATLITLAGIAVKFWQASRAQKVGPQPFEVKPAAEYRTAAACDKSHASIEKQTENLFCRMASAEQRVARVEATIVEIKDQYHSIDSKLTTLLQRPL